jgi:hypothetical protein
VLPATELRAEDLDVPAVWELEDPEARLVLAGHGPQAQHVLVEVRQLLIMVGAGAAPAQACDFHARQYRRPPGRVGVLDGDCHGCCPAHRRMFSRLEGYQSMRQRRSRCQRASMLPMR